MKHYLQVRIFPFTWNILPYVEQGTSYIGNDQKGRITSVKVGWLFVIIHWWRVVK